MMDGEFVDDHRTSRFLPAQHRCHSAGASLGPHPSTLVLKSAAPAFGCSNSL
jgi:hypothetical protein